MHQKKYDAFNRKFIVSKKPLSHSFIEGWQQHRLGEYYVQHNPNLSFTQHKQGKFDAVLFGFVFDFETPSLTNEQILNDLVEYAKTHEDIIVGTNKLCGRWVLLIHDGSNLFVANDAMGQMQLFYHIGDANTVISPSDHLIAHVMGFKRSQTALKELFEPYDDITGFWFVGTSTIYDDVKCLVPDYYLDVNVNQQIRFWPREKVKQVDRDENFATMHRMLNGFTKAFFNRYEGALALTAGLDSRVLLAHCKPYKDALMIYTINDGQEDRPDRYLDRVVPKEISEKFSLHYELIDHQGEAPQDFIDEYNKNATFDRPIFRRMAYLLLLKYPQQKLSIQACDNEVARSRYGYPPFKLRLRDLANLTMMGDNPFVRRHLKSWLADANEVNKKYGVRIEDLFFVEQRIGRWSAMNRNEWDIAQDVFEPFNSRDLVLRIFEIDKIDKVRFPNNFYNYLFNQTWPELMQVRTSVQPKPKKSFKIRAKEYVKAMLYAIS